METQPECSRADGYLAKYRPDLLHLPTTNGEHCTGDGIKMGTFLRSLLLDRKIPNRIADGSAARAQHSPGAQATGENRGERVGAKTIDLEWVQVHPTGLVKPDDADAKVCTRGF